MNVQQDSRPLCTVEIRVLAFLANTAYEFLKVNVFEILFHSQRIFFRGYAL